MTDRDERELEWWRRFASKVEPGGDLPRVGSALLGERFSVSLVEPPA